MFIVKRSLQQIPQYILHHGWWEEEEREKLFFYLLVVHRKRKVNHNKDSLKVYPHNGYGAFQYKHLLLKVTFVCILWLP